MQWVAIGCIHVESGMYVSIPNLTINIFHKHTLPFLRNTNFSGFRACLIDVVPYMQHLRLQSEIDSEFCPDTDELAQAQAHHRLSSQIPVLLGFRYQLVSSP